MDFKFSFSGFIKFLSSLDRETKAFKVQNQCPIFREVAKAYFSFHLLFYQLYLYSIKTLILDFRS